MLGMRPSNRTHEQLSTSTLNAEVEVARHDRNARIFEASASAWARTVEAMSTASARIVEAVASAPWGWLLLIALWERFQ
jgi:hypothetical protein